MKGEPVKIYRQGDVLIQETTAAPTNAVEVPRDKGRIVLAYGEVTGHAHAIHGSGAVAVREPETGRESIIVRADAIASTVGLRGEEYAPLVET